MFDIRELPALFGLSDPLSTHPGVVPDHGLGRRDEFPARLALFGVRSNFSIPAKAKFGIIDVYPLSLDAGAKDIITRESSRLSARIAHWADVVSYTPLSDALSVNDDETSDAKPAETSDTSARSISKRLVLSPQPYGFFQLYPTLLRGFASADINHDTSDQTAEIARRALEELLPQQAYFFVPPQDLMLAQKEAERMAREALEGAKKSLQNKEAKPEDIHGQIKRKLAHGLRGLRARHDGRMHIFPHTRLSAPETGVATIAIIASQQQSIIGDHGRVSGTARGLVI